MRRIATGRIVGLLVAVIGVGLSVWCARDASRMNAEFHQWRVARPLESAIDLSKPGETTVALHQTCSTSHGEALFLKCNLEDSSNQSPGKQLSDLSGSVTIKNLDGSVIESVKINKDTLQDWEGKIMLTGFAPFSNGDYIAVIRVDSGAAALVGKQHTIYAEYQLCGLEQMPAAIAGAFAFGAGLIGLVGAMCVLPGLVRRGIWRSVRGGCCCSDQP
jgi:hypothetical protein